MRKVRYPGPAASHARGSSYFSAFGIVLHPGINKVSDKTAEKLLDAGLVVDAEEVPPVTTETTHPFDYEEPVKEEEGEAKAPPIKRLTRKLLGEEE